MSFRKRNIVVSSLGKPSFQATHNSDTVSICGVRPSPLDGRLTTSTGTRSLDALLAGHAGLVLGTSILVEESGTMDFAGVLLRYFAAEGIVQNHRVHVLGLNEAWGRELPGLAGALNESQSEGEARSTDKMKIAWRYERLGEFGRDRGNGFLPTTQPQNVSKSSVFCHDFDLSKRMTLSSSSLKFIPLGSYRTQFGLTENHVSPFTSLIQHLSLQLSKDSPTTIHRVVIPNLLSPAIYPQVASKPSYVLSFLHALRSLLRQYPGQLTILISYPLSLYPRSSGLTRWMEMLSDGVIELAPFPSHAAVVPAANVSASSTGHEEPPQGLLKMHRLPILHDKGGGGSESVGVGDDMAFTLSRKKGLVIKPFSLPPLAGDTEAQEERTTNNLSSMATRNDIEF